MSAEEQNNTAANHNARPHAPKVPAEPEELHLPAEPDDSLVPEPPKDLLVPDEPPAPVTPADEKRPASNSDAAPGGQPTFSAHMRSFATNARRMTDSLTEQTGAGFSAMREVSRARREHRQAKSGLEQLQATYDKDAQELKRRREILANFDEIAASQEEAIAQASTRLDAAQQRAESHKNQAVALTRELDEMKRTHVEKLKPAKRTLDLARDANDAAAKEYATAKKATRAASGAHSDIARKRDNRIVSANRAIETSERRLDQLTQEMAAAQRDPATPASELSRLRGEHAQEMARLSRAREELDRAPHESADALARAAQRRQNSGEIESSARVAADSAKKAFRQAKAAYEREVAAQKQREGALEERALEAERQAREYTKQAQEEERQLDQAKAILADAQAIHQDPAQTDALEAALQTTYERLHAERERVSQLSSAEDELRVRTRASRTTFILVAVAVVLIIVLILVWIFVQAPQ